ncbi:hypothetical protein C8R47DRAFT_1118694 [Mycena vitilis]|nr:hypothetical protein C8R47DRAFT_1118694 [Mycena vitilis]
MFRIARLTTSSALRVNSPLLLPCRSYFRTAITAAKHKKQKSIPPIIKVPLKPVTRQKAKPSHAEPVVQPSQPPADPLEPPAIPPGIQTDQRTSSFGRNQLLFAGIVVVDVFLWAAVKTNTQTDELAQKITHGHGAEGLSNSDLFQAKISELAQKMDRLASLVFQATQHLPAVPRSAINEAYVAIRRRMITTSDAVKVCWGICVVNGAVFLAWQVPRLGGFMTRNFIHHPLSGRAFTMLTNVFSHFGFFHLLFNSMALLSFGAAAGSYLSAMQARSPSKRLESTSGYHFLAFFISAGVVSSLASHFVRVRIYDRALALLSKTRSATPPHIVGSLGASGAVYACVTVSALAYPDARVSVMLMPLMIPIRTGVGAMVLFDILGVIRGWRSFDHIAHLSGALFGVWYYLYGPRVWDLWRATAAYLFGDKPTETRAVET